MPMPDALTWLIAAAAGVALGAFFFGGLWWTVRRSFAARRSPMWHVGGLLLRMAVTVLGFYAVGAGQWQRLAACLAGFVVARAIVLRSSRRWGQDTTAPTPEVKHAPQP